MDKNNYLRITRQGLRLASAAAVTCLLAVTGLLASSCSDLTDDAGTALPPGTYPMTFTAQVDGLSAPNPTSRATTGNTWDGAEEVAIQTGGEMKKYTAAADGSLSVAGGGTPFYWQTTGDITVNAWYPYSAIKPIAADLRVKADQREGNNYQSSDCLEAVDATVSFNNPVFTFTHRTAKVVVTLEAGEGVADVSDAAVTFVNQTGVEGGGTEVIPKKETPGNGGATTYFALVIPQQMQNQKFIKVTIGADGAARDYYYTPAGTNDANLESGKQYTYTITVKKTGLAVAVTGNGTAWTDESVTTNPDDPVTFHITAPKEGVMVEAVLDGGNLNDVGEGSYTLSGGNTVSITATSTYIQSIKGLYEVAGDGKTYTLKSDLLITGYTLADARVGDFYCKSSDGSTGYLIPNEATLTEAQQSVCIGIVYSTDASRIGEAATQALAKKSVNSPHGLVMALTDAFGGCQWGDYGKDENSGGGDGAPFKANTDQLKKQYENVDGYGETHWIIDTYGSSGTTLQDTYTAFYHAGHYGTSANSSEKYAAPTNTTDWFIPSMGQWWDILSNLGEINLDKYKSDTDGSIEISGAANTAVANMNKYLQKISDATQFRTVTYFWSSSEHDGIQACYVGFCSGVGLNLDWGYKGGYCRVRCSFAF